MRIFGLFGWRRGNQTLRPEQRMSNATLQQEKVDEIVSKQDARYDAMTEEEREKYYLQPNLTTRIKKALRGQ
jgi:hypothetical protein